MIEHHITPAHRMLVKRLSPSQRAAMPALQPRAVCATCPALDECPVCPKGQMCQLQVPPSCQQCPKHVCVPDPDASHDNKAASLGGAIAGILTALALAVVLLWFWRRRHQRAKEAVQRARADAKERTASGEKFRIGGGEASAAPEGKDAGLTRQRSTAASIRSSNGDSVIDEDNDDVEWTELRADGLTAFRNRPGSNDGQDVAQDIDALRRRSIGAATHLSRITEGAEDDEDDNGVREALRRSAHRNTIIEEDESERSVHLPYISDAGHSVVAGGEGQPSHAAERNPFSDDSQITAEILSATSSYDPDHARDSMSTRVAGNSTRNSDTGRHSGSSWPMSPLSASLRVLRPTGAPVVDLTGKPRSPYASGGQSVPVSPLPPSQTMTPPLRPVRDATLNLRLDDGSEPGKIGDDIKKRGDRFTSSVASASQMQPSEPSEYHDSYEARDLPAQLADSTAYSKQGKAGSPTNRASVMTAATTSSVGTFDYVMSAPRIVASEGPKRVQVQAGGKAQLVRSISAVRREKEAAAAAAAQRAQAGDGTDLQANPFADGNASDGQRSIDTQNDKARPDSETISGGSTETSRLRAHDAAAANRGTSSLRASNMSTASLPFVDERPIIEPAGRSPTDAHYRDSISGVSTRTLARPDPQSLRHSSASSLDGNALHPQARQGTLGRSLYADRQSGASIGGLSVFDDIPFHISEGAASGSQASAADMPADAQRRIEESKRRIEAEEDESRGMAAESASSDFGKPRQLVAAGSPSPSSVRSSTKSTSSNSHQPRRTGTQPAFDEIRLRHELDNYPFELSSSPSRTG